MAKLSLKCIFVLCLVLLVADDIQAKKSSECPFSKEHTRDKKSSNYIVNTHEKSGNNQLENPLNDYENSEHKNEHGTYTKTDSLVYTPQQLKVFKADELKNVAYSNPMAAYNVSTDVPTVAHEQYAATETSHGQYAQEMDGKFVYSSAHNTKQQPHKRHQPQHYGDFLQESTSTSFNNWLKEYIGKTDELKDLGEHFTARKEKEHLKCAMPPQTCQADERNYYFRRLDGACNNLQYPAWGMAGSRYERLAPPAYSDGVNAMTQSLVAGPLPNARAISMTAFGETTLPDKGYRTLLTMNFGQFVAHDISNVDTSLAPEDCCESPKNPHCMPIYLKDSDPIAMGTGTACMSFARATTDADLKCPSNGKYHYEKISLPTAHLDLSMVYGNSEKDGHNLREKYSGLLKTAHLDGKQYLPITHNANGECANGVEHCFKVSDDRENLTPTLSVVHTLFVREHNRLANMLAKMNPHYNSEEIYQQARKLNIAQYQKIVYYEYLPAILSSSFAYNYQLAHYVQPYDYVNDYDPSISTAPLAEFSTAAFRYLHNNIPGWFTKSSRQYNNNETLRISDFFDQPVDLLVHQDNFHGLVKGLTTQLQKNSDGHIDSEMKHFCLRERYQEFGIDLKAFDIQRARDFGLASYNTVREYCGLRKAYDWSDFSNELSAESIAILSKLYKTPEDVELNVGAVMEHKLPESLFGPTFQCIIGKQFLKTRIGDRFFFENANVHSSFTRDQLSEIRKSTMSSILCNNADYLEHIQRNPFFASNEWNTHNHCYNIPQIDLTKWISY